MDLRRNNFFSFNPSAAAKAVILLLPVVFGVLIVQIYGANVSHFDEIEYMRSYDNFFTFEHLWQQHNEHRMFFPNIITYIAGSLSAWNSKVFMMVSQAFIIVLYLVVIRVYADGKRFLDFSWKDTAFCTVLGFCIWHTCQYENILWGFQIAWFMIVSLGAASYFFFDKYLKTEKLRYLVLSMIFAVIVSFSSLHGLTVWGGYVVVLFFGIFKAERLPKLSFAVVIPTCILTVAAYFYNWTSVSGHTLYLATDLKSLISSLLKLICEPFAFFEDDGVSYLISFVILLLLTVCAVSDLIRHRFIANFKIYGTLIMGFCMLFVISAGRSGSNGGATASRYTTNSVLFLVYFFLLCVNKIKQRGDIIRDNSTLSILERGIPFVNILVMIGFSALLPFSIADNFTNVINRGTILHEGQFLMANYSTTTVSEFSTYIYPVNEDSVEEFRTLFAKMEDNKLNVFSESNIDELQCSETKLPDCTLQDVGEKAFTSDNVSGDALAIRIEIRDISELSGFTSAQLSGSKFYISLNDKIYYAALVNGHIRFVKSAEEVGIGVYEIALYIENSNTLYKFETQCLYKSDIGDVTITEMQLNGDFLESINVKGITVATCVDYIDGVLGGDTCLINNSVNTIEGWIELDSTENQELYLNIDDAYYKLDWVDRTDLIDTGYVGYKGTFVPLFDNAKNSEIYLVVVNQQDKSAYRVYLKNIDIISPFVYSEIAEGKYTISSYNGEQLYQVGNECRIGNLTDGSSNLIFNITKVESCVYAVYDQSMACVADIKDGSADKGATVQFYGEYLGNDNQHWRFIAVDGMDGAYYIQSMVGTFLSVSEDRSVITDLYSIDNKNIIWFLKKQE